MKARLFYVPIFILIIGLSACKKNSISIEELNGYWVLNSFEGKGAKSVFKGALPTIEFDAEKLMLYGTSGCNNYGGKFLIEDDRLKIQDIFSTEIECLEENQESKFIGHLNQSYTLLIEGNTLKFTNNESQTIMEFVKGDSFETKDEENSFELERFTGEWVLNKIEGKDASDIFAFLPSLTFDFNTNKIGGLAGCSQYSASFKIDKGLLIIEPVISTKTDCKDTFNEKYFIGSLADTSVISMPNESDLHLLKNNIALLEFRRY
jgi:heat shock protein HslJ